MHAIQKDLDSTYQDINQNMEKILKHMDKDPFQLILSQYSDKIKRYEFYSDKIRSEQLTLLRINLSFSSQQNKRLENELAPIIQNLFGSYIT